MKRLGTKGGGWSNVVANVPIGAVIVVGLILPVAILVPYSFREWSIDSGGFGVGVSVEPYIELFGSVGMTVFTQSAINAAIALGLVALVAIPLGLMLRLRYGKRAVLLAELILVIPFLSNQSLRIHAIREAVISLNTYISIDGSGLLPGTGSRGLVILSLGLSYAALFCWPYFHSLNSVDEEQVLAMRDMGLGGKTIVRRLLLPQSAMGVFIGGILMFLVALFSGLEYTIAGSGSSVANIVMDMISAENYPQAYAFAVSLCVVSVSMFMVVIMKSDILSFIES